MKSNKKIIYSCIFAILTLTLIFTSGVNVMAKDSVNFKDAHGLLSSGGISKEDDSVTVGSRFLELIFGKKEEKKAESNIYLCPGGDAFGVKISGSGVTVSKIINDTSASPLKIDDRILSIDGKRISTIQEVKDILNSSGGKVLDFEVLRGGKEINLKITPHRVGSEYHLGVILNDGASGIGTITYYNPETLEFGGLGHGICAKDSKEVLKMTRGEVTGVILAGAKRGEVAKPGELRGVLTDKIIGNLNQNTSCGVFGTLTSEAINKNPTENKALPIASRDEVKEGTATIISTIKNGKKAEYEIEIYDIERSSKESKSFKIRVTDDTLLALTGGIVRGMGVCYNRDNTVKLE